MAAEVLTEVVPDALDGERVDRVVSLLTGRSRSEVTELVRVGGVELDGVVVPAGKLRVAAGQVLLVRPGDAPGTALPEADAGVAVSVVYEDADILVVDKPAGMVVHPGAGREGGTLVSGLLARYPEVAAVGDPTRPGIVHRLDRDTSGLLVVARTSVAYEQLVADLAARTVTRRYVALVWGVPDPRHGIVDAPIGRSPRQPMRQAVVADGRPARTRYAVRAVYAEPAEMALLGLELETGRTHQIRVHLQAIGHPVVGDRDYGGERGRIRTHRMFLHAEHLAFVHPTTGAALSFDAPLPPDLASVLAHLTPA